jgi:hypothetical protein
MARKRSNLEPSSPEPTVAERTSADEDVVSDIAQPDPKQTTSYRLALGAVITLGVLIVIGVAILIVGLVKGWGNRSDEASAVPEKPKEHVTITIPPGYTILSTDTQPGRLILHIRSTDRDEILVIDTQNGAIVAEINASASK